jgi:amino acid efflux transporter
MNAYVAAAVRLAGALAEEGSAPRLLGRPRAALAVLAAVAALVLVPLGLDILGVDGLIRATSAAFVAVYVLATAAGVRLLEGTARACAAVAFVAVTAVFAFFGAYLLVPAAVAALAIGGSLWRAPGRARTAPAAPALMHDAARSCRRSPC